MKGLLSLLALMLFSWAAVAHSGPGGGHLSFSQGRLHAHLSWVQGPDENSGESKLRLEWHDGVTHALVAPPGEFSVILWMPDMGHGSAPTQIQQMTVSGAPSRGTYFVSNIFFLMPGLWEIRVRLSSTDGGEETQVWPVSIGGGSGEMDHSHHH